MKKKEATSCWLINSISEHIKTGQVVHWTETVAFFLCSNVTGGVCHKRLELHSYHKPDHLTARSVTGLEYNLHHKISLVALFLSLVFCDDVVMVAYSTAPDAHLITISIVHNMLITEVITSYLPLDYSVLEDWWFILEFVTCSLRGFFLNR